MQPLMGQELFWEASCLNFGICLIVAGALQERIQNLEGEVVADYHQHQRR